MNNKKTMQLTIVSLALLMLTTGVVYLVVSIEQTGEVNATYVERNAGESIEGGLIQTVLFATVGGAYIPVGLWAISSRHSSKTPYFLALLGSVALIILYILSRTIDLPLVGKQDDVGFIDILSKVLQCAIISISAYIIVAIRREKNLVSLSLD
jgi:hypothetical protein